MSSDAPAVDVAEADRRLGRGDADRRDVAGVGRDDRLLDRPTERPHIADHVVGGERPDDHVGLAARQDGGGQPDRGRRVLRLALEHDVGVGELGQLLFDGGAVSAAGDDHDPLVAGERGEPLPGAAQQRGARPGEIVQELGGVGAGERPEPGADTAGRDDAVEASSAPGSIAMALTLCGAARATRTRLGSERSLRRATPLETHLLEHKGGIRVH